MTTVAIHQPGYLPWLGFFKKMMQSDIFVFWDDIQYERQDWYNRNMIRTYSGSTWLIIPVHGHQNLDLNEVKIDNTKNWSKKHKKTIQLNYSKTPHYAKYWYFFEELYEKNYDLLIDLNVDIIRFIMSQLEIKTKIIFSSELNISDKGSDKVLKICKELYADIYVSGTVWAKDHLKIEDFVKNNIQVKFQTFQHPVYNQIHGKFIPNMSIIDLLFNEGARAKEILLNSLTV